MTVLPTPEGTPSDAAEFWALVRKTHAWGCWPYTGPVNADGYGIWRGELAHRVAWRLTKGPVPDGLGVLHICDFPPCCNVLWHTYCGTAQANVIDAITRGRFRRSADSYLAVAAREAVATRSARSTRLAAGLSWDDVAEQCGVSRWAVRHWERAERVPADAAVAYGRLLAELDATHPPLFGLRAA